MSHKATTKHAESVNVLCLDGGGVRGLSSLLILRCLMRQLRIKFGLVTDPRPCEIFHLICGTSTGGLTALMLGRLRMTVEQAIACYLQFSATVFGKKLPSAQSRAGSVMYDASTLEKFVKKLVKDYGGHPKGEDAPLRDSRENCCRTFVVAVAADYADSRPVYFRSYPTESRPADACKIWEAARATTAASPFFEPTKFGTPPANYVDGAFSGANNPSKLAHKEISKLFPAHPIDCFLSLGTGVLDVVKLKGDVAKIAKACEKLITSCEVVADEVGEDFDHEKPYFRFSVDRGLGKIALDEWRLVPELTGITDRYMEFSIQERKARVCVEALGRRVKVVEMKKEAEKEESIT